MKEPFSAKLASAVRTQARLDFAFDCPFCGKPGHAYFSHRRMAGFCFRCETPFFADQAIAAEEGVSLAVAKERLSEALCSSTAGLPLALALAGLKTQAESVNAQTRERGLWLAPPNVLDLSAEGETYMNARGASTEGVFTHGQTGGVLFPVYNAWGVCVAYVVRSIREGSLWRWRNSSGFVKRSHLFRQERLRVKRPAFVVLCEGIFDALALERSAGKIGVDCVACAVFGSSVSDLQLNAVRPYRLVLAFDNDDKGRACTESVQVRRRDAVCVKYDGHDPDEADCEALAYALRASLR